MRTSPFFLAFLAFASMAGAVAGCSDDTGVVQLFAQMEVDPPRLDFANVQVGTTLTKEVFVRNPGEALLTLKGVSRSTPFDEAFTFELDRTSVVPSGVGVIRVTFSPTEIGERSARLLVEPQDLNLGGIEVDLIGMGVSSTLLVDPTLLSFGNVVVGTQKTRQITLTNASAVDADIEYVDGTNVKPCTSGIADPATFCVVSRDRPLGPDQRFRLPAGEATALDVQFKPVIAGTRERGSFKLKSCPLPACEVEIKVDGVGIEQGFRCMPASLAFGFVNPGSCVTSEVSCENVANEQVTVIDWHLASQGGSPSSADFTLETPMVQVLAEGDSVSIDVTYCPSSLGDDEGVLEIETDNVDPRLRSVFVPLEGTGGGADIDVVPAQLNFGLVSLIAPSRRTVTIQNVGFSPLEIIEIIADTAGTRAFTTPGASATQVPVGGFVDVTVEFQPTAEGPVASELLIRSSDQDEPEVRVRLLGEGINLPPCAFEVSPAQLSFGVVERSRILSRAFEIRNVGTNDCLVTSARIVPGSDQEFSLPDGDVSSLIIPPASSTSIRVQYAPTAIGDNSGRVEFSISSPRSPFNEVPLTGSGADAALLIVPNDLDFGVIGVGCSARSRAVTIYNTGSSPASITAIAITPSSAAFTLTNVPALPLTLSPGGTTSFDVGFHADAIASYAAAVEITGTFGGSAVTYVVSLLGRGATDATQVDNFEQLGKPKVDILFVIDDSCSMFEEQTSLASNFAAFIQFAQAQGIDYQIAVTTTDVDSGGFGTTGPQGRFVPLMGGTRIVTPETQPSPEAVFSQNVNVGTNGSATEQGLQAAYLALSNPLIFAHNAGFLRPDAVLSIIFVSDEQDQSTGAVDFFVNFFLSIKGFRNTNLFTASAIVGDTPSGCNGPGGSADDGIRYIETSNRTGGIFQSICTNDWSRALEDLSTTAFGFKSRFFLSNQPIISTLRVFLDGVELPANGPGGTVNWNYDYGTNSINFSPFATPEPGAQIRAEYTVECL